MQHFFVPIGRCEVGSSFPVEQSRSRVELATAKMSSGIAVVEEVAFAYQPTQRLLSFAPLLEDHSLVTINTEYNAVPGTGVIDFKNTKLLSQHRAMVNVMETYPPVTENPSILVVGLGGGVVPSVLKTYFPLAKITVVEIEPALEKVSNRNKFNKLNVLFSYSFTHSLIHFLFINRLLVSTSKCQRTWR